MSNRMLAIFTKIKLSAFFILLFFCNNLLADIDINPGLEYLDQEQYDKAVDYFETAIEIHNHEAKLYNYLGISLYRTGEVGDSVKQFERAVELAPGNALYHTDLANAYRLLGAAGEVGVLKMVSVSRKVINNYLKAYELDNQDPHIIEDAARILLEIPGFMGGDRELAEQYIETLSVINPAGALFLQGVIAGKDKEYQLKEEKYLQAIEASPNSDFQGNVTYSLAQHYFDQKEYELAIKTAKQFIPLDHPWYRPQLVDAYRLMARAYKKKNETEKSREFYELALANTNISNYKKNIEKELRKL